MVLLTVLRNVMLAITATQVLMRLTRMALSVPQDTTVHREPSFLLPALTVSTRLKVQNQKMIARTAKPVTTAFDMSHPQLCLNALSVITAPMELMNLYLALRVPIIHTLSLSRLIDVCSVLRELPVM
jgi:predicted O-linked N-acetylglucosamine transferase (SPINDLY family)